MNVIHFLKLSIHYYTWRILEYDGTPNTPPNTQPKTKNKLEQSRIQQKSRVHDPPSSVENEEVKRFASG